LIESSGAVLAFLAFAWRATLKAFMLVEIASMAFLIVEVECEDAHLAPGISSDRYGGALSVIRLGDPIGEAVVGAAQNLLRAITGVASLELVGGLTTPTYDLSCWQARDHG